MNEQLQLGNIRDVLSRLEETILYALIERAQFHCNPTVYEPGRFGPAVGGLCLMDYLLRETEIIHARMRRYTSPDEHPFFQGLPEPILPRMAVAENPLIPNTINLNERIRSAYVANVIPRICAGGDDGQYGSSSVADVACLQAISKRIHYGKFVAESKYRSAPARFRSAAAAGDRDRLVNLITDPAVEEAVLRRVDLKARAYGRDGADEKARYNIDPAVAVVLFRDWIIPANKEVQVLYIRERVAKDSGT